MSNTRLQVLVIGGGIAGLAAGVMLREFADVTILESASELKEIGAALTPGPGATAILRRFGIHLEKERGCVSDGVQIWGSDGQLYTQYLYRTEGGYMDDVISIHRADLHSALLRRAVLKDGLGKPCTILLDHKVSSLDRDSGIVNLMNGKSLRGDVIIAADGIRSNTRSFIIGEDATPEASGESAYRMLLRLEDLQAINHSLLKDGEIPPVVHLVVAPQRQLVMYPIRERTLLNVVAFVPDSELHEKVDDKWTSPGSIEALVSSFEHFSPQWTDLLSAGKDVAVWQMRDLSPLNAWVKGRAILIGDAAHPMLPHQASGAMSAIEDAEALSVYLRHATSDASSVHSALAQVFRVRYKRASQCQELSRANNILNVKPGASIGRIRSWDYPGAERWSVEHPEMLLDV